MRAKSRSLSNPTPNCDKIRYMYQLLDNSYRFSPIVYFEKLDYSKNIDQLQFLTSILFHS